MSHWAHPLSEVRQCPTMLSELLAIDLLLITSLLAHISYHCFQFQRERPQILDTFNGKSTELSDIGDLLDRGKPAGPAQQAASGIPELLLTALMNRTAMPPPDGEKETGTKQGEIHFQEQPEETQTGNESR
jgi:hypothetical protein